MAWRSANRGFRQHVRETADRRPEAPPTPSAPSSSGRGRYRKSKDQEPQMLSTAEAGSRWPSRIHLFDVEFDATNVSHVHLTTHGFYRFLQLYANDSRHLKRVLSLPIVKFFGEDGDYKEFVKYLVDNIIPVVGLIPVECLLRQAVSSSADNEYTGEILSILMVVMFGFNDVQLHWIYHTFFEQDFEHILKSRNGETPMAWLAKHFSREISSQTESTVDEHGSRIEDFNVCHPSLIFQHCSKTIDAWNHPPHQDFAAQGKPSLWGQSYCACFNKSMYDILCKFPESDWVSTMRDQDTVERIFKDTTITNMVGHLAIESIDEVANFRGLWSFYALLAVRPTKHGMTIRDLQRVPRETESVLPPANKIDPVKSLHYALEEYARSCSPKGGTSDASFQSKISSWRSDGIKPFYGVAAWPCVADVVQAMYQPHHPDVHPLFYDLVADEPLAMTLLDKLGIHSASVHFTHEDGADQYYATDSILRGRPCDAPALFKQYEIDQSEGRNLLPLEDSEPDRVHRAIPLFCFPLTADARDEEEPRCVRADWKKGDSGYEYLLNGIKVPAVSSILFHNRLKSSDHKNPHRGESQSEDGSAIVYGFDSYNRAATQFYATWTYLGNGMYYQVSIELHPKPGEEIRSLKRPGQKYITENHSIGYVFVSVIHVNSLRAYRPTNMPFQLPRSIDPNDSARNSFYKHGQAIRFPVENEATPVDFTLVYSSLWNSIKHKLNQGKDFGMELLHKLSAGIFQAKSVSPDGQGGASAATESSEVITSSGKQSSSFLVGSLASEIKDPRPNPRLRCLVGTPIEGDSTNQANWDFTVGEDVSNLGRHDSVRTCQLALDRAVRAKLIDLMESDLQLMKAGNFEDEDQGSVTKGARNMYALWVESCDRILPYLSKAQPYYYPPSVMDDLKQRYTSPRIVIAALINSGDSLAAGKLARGLLSGNRPPCWDFASKCDTTIIGDSALDIKFSAKKVKGDYEFMRWFPSATPSSKKSQQELTFNYCANYILCGAWPNDMEQTINDYQEMMTAAHWKGLLTGDSRSTSADHMEGQRRKKDDRTYGVLYRHDYFSKFGAEGSPHGNFDGKSSERVRVKVQNGAGLFDIKLMLQKTRNEILSELNQGRPLRSNRCCILTYTVNDIFKGRGNQFVIHKGHWESDLQFILDDVIQTAQKTYGDNIAFLTGIDSDLLYDRKVEAYDEIQNEILAHLRKRQIFTVNLAEHWQGLEFQDAWHLDNSAKNTFKMAEVINSIALILSWRSHDPNKCFNDFEYGDYVSLDGKSGYVRCGVPTRGKIEMALEVPYSNIPIDDKAMETFLASRLYNAVKTENVASLKTLTSDCGSDDPLGTLQPWLTKEEAEAPPTPSEDPLSPIGEDDAPQPDSTGGAELTEEEEKKRLKSMSADNPPTKTTKSGPFQNKELAASGQIMDDLGNKPSAKADSTAGAIGSESMSSNQPTPVQQRLQRPRQQQQPSEQEQLPAPPKAQPVPKGNVKGTAKTDSTVSSADDARRLDELKPVVKRISKNWNEWFQSSCLTGKTEMNGDPYQMEDILSAFLWHNKRRGRGKRTRKDRYRGPDYTLPYNGPLHIPRLGLDLGNVVFEDFCAVPGYVVARVNHELMIILYILSLILHPDIFHFISWGVQWHQIIRNLAAMNFLYEIYTQSSKTERRDQRNIPDPRFHEVLYNLFNYKRGCQGTIVLPGMKDGRKNNPKDYVGAEEGSAWVDGPATQMKDGALNTEYPVVTEHKRHHHSLLEKFSKFDKRWKSYHFLSEDSKHGKPFRPQEPVGKIKAMAWHGTDVFIDDDAGQCSYLDSVRNNSDTGHIVMPIHSQRRMDRDGRTVHHSKPNEKFMGRSASDPVACIKIYVEYLMYAMGHNAKHGHIKDEHSMFPPDWDKRATLQTGGDYPSAFGIPANKGIDLAKAGIPNPNKADGDVESTWFNEDSIMRKILTPTKTYLQLAQELQEIHERRNERDVVSGKVKRLGDSLASGFADWAPQGRDPKPYKPLAGSKPSSTGGTEAASSSAEMGFCLGCKQTMTQADHWEHVCATPDAPIQGWCPANKPTPTVQAESIGGSGGQADDDDMEVDEETVPEFPVGDEERISIRHIKEFHDNDEFSDYVFDPSKIVVDRNCGEEMNEHEFIQSVSKEAQSRELFERQRGNFAYPTTSQTTTQYLIKEVDKYNGTNPDCGIGAIKQENFPPTMEDSYLEKGDVFFNFDPKNSSPSERKLYLFSSGDSRSKYRTRYGCVMTDIPPDFVLGRVVAVQYSLNYVCVLLNAPSLKEIVDAGIYVYKPFLRAYARGYITHLWAIAWSSHDINGAPTGRPRGTIGTLDEIKAALYSHGHLAMRGATDPEKDGLAVLRLQPMKAAIISVAINMRRGPEKDPYLTLVQYDYHRPMKHDEEVENPWADLEGTKPRTTKKEKHMEKIDEDAEMKGEDDDKKGKGDDDGEEYGTFDEPEWTDCQSDLLTQGPPDSINLASALQLCKEEYDRINCFKKAEILPYPSLATEFFRYRGEVICKKCPFYHFEYNPHADFARQLWYNTIGSEIMEIPNKEPGAPPVKFKGGRDSKLVKGETFWIREMLKPRRFFQACVVDREINVKDVDNYYYKTDGPLVNVWKSRFNIYEQGKDVTPMRFVRISVLPGDRLIAAIRQSPIGLFYKPMLSQGLEEELPAGSTGLTQREIDIIEEHLGAAFRAKQRQRNIAAKSEGRIDVNSAPLEYLRTYQMMDYDERNRAEDWLRVIEAVTKRFVWQNTVNAIVIPQEFERDRKTIVTRMSEDTNSVVYNVVEIIDMLDTSKLKNHYDRRDAKAIIAKANPILRGHRNDIRALEGCWFDTDVVMPALCSALAAGYDNEAMDPDVASRNTICPVLLLLVVLSKDKGNPYEVKVELVEEPEGKAKLKPSAGTAPRYNMPVASGLDISVQVQKTGLSDLTFEAFQRQLLDLPNNRMPGAWDTIVTIKSVHGMATDPDASFQRKVRITHIRRVHGFKKDDNPPRWPAQHFKFSRTLNACRATGRPLQRKLKIATDSSKIPEYLFFNTAKVNVKVMARQGFILGNANYSFAGDVDPDPNESQIPIVCSTIPHWADNDKTMPSPESRLRDRDGVTIVIHARATYLEGWEWKFNDRGAWTTKYPIATGFIVGIVQCEPIFRLVYWRPYVVTGFDQQVMQQYILRENEGTVFDHELAMTDKRLPIDKCACCEIIQLYGSSFCAECQSPMFSGTWIPSKFIPPPSLFQLSLKQEARIVVANQLRRMIGGHGRHWDQKYYAWHVAPMFDIRLEDEDIEEDDPDEVQINIKELKQELVDYRGDPRHYFSTWLRQAQALGDWHRFCTIGSTFASAVQASLSRGFSIESSARMRTYIATARKFIEEDFDTDVISLINKDAPSKRRGSYHHVNYVQSPARRAADMDLKDMKSIRDNVERLKENPNLTAESPSLTRVGYAMGQYTSVVDRIYRDTVFRNRLHRAWMDQYGRIDQDMVRFSVNYLLAHALEAKIAEKTALLSVSEAEEKIIVPHFDDHTKPGAMTYESDTRDEMLKLLRGKFDEIKQMAKVMIIDRSQLKKYLADYELCVPTTENEEKRRRFRFEQVLETERIKPASTGDAETGMMSTEEETGKKTILEHVHEYMYENLCCRCGYKHPLTSVAKYYQCSECYSACCNNDRCHLLPCKGKYELIALKMQAMTMRRGKVEFATPQYGPAEHKRKVLDVQAEAKAGPKPPPPKMRKEEEESSSSRDRPWHKTVNPQTEDFFTFQEMEARMADNQGEDQPMPAATGKAVSTAASEPRGSDYSNRVPEFKHTIIVGEQAHRGGGKGSGKRAREDQGDDDEQQRPIKKGKGKGKDKQKKGKPEVDWDARAREREARPPRPGAGTWSALLFPEAADDSTSASAAADVAAPKAPPKLLRDRDWQPTLSRTFFNPSATKLSSAGSHSRAGAAPRDSANEDEDDDMGRADIHEAVAQMEPRHAMFRDIREPVDVVSLANVKVSKPASTGATRASGSRAASSAAASESIRMWRPHLAPSSAASSGPEILWERDQDPDSDVDYDEKEDKTFERTRKK